LLLEKFGDAYSSTGRRELHSNLARRTWTRLRTGDGMTRTQHILLSGILLAVAGIAFCVGCVLWAQVPEIDRHAYIIGKPTQFMELPADEWQSVDRGNKS
jgi:hypothetical protein